MCTSYKDALEVDCFRLHVIVCHYINRSIFINLSFASVAGRWRSNPKPLNTNAIG